MRRLLLLVGFCLLASPAWATWGTAGNVTQAVFNNSCAASSSCAVTVSAIGAGKRLLVVLAHIGNTQTLSSVTAAGETFTVITGGGAGSSCPFNGGGNVTQMGCAYALTSVGGATTVTCNWSGTASATNTSCAFYEIAYTAPRIFLESNSLNSSHGSASTFAGVNFANNYTSFINGTNDIIFQFANVSTGTVSAIDTSFVLDNHTGQVADAHRLNTYDNTAPTWTNSVAATSLVSGFSFGEDYNPNTPTTIPASTPSSGLRLSYSGSVGTRLVTVIAPGQFELIFDEGDNWGIAYWYDLVNDPTLTTNLLIAYPPGANTLSQEEPGLFNRTYYDIGDVKQFTRPAQYYFPTMPRQLSVLEYNSSRIVIETKSQPCATAAIIGNNLIGTIRYYIYPNGQVYVHSVATVTNAMTFTVNGIFTDITLQDPTKTVAGPPDTQGFIRASTTQNPYTGIGTVETYLFAYWAPTTPAPYTNYTKASVLIVRSPSNLYDAGQIIHSWASGPGYGTLRWGWSGPGVNVNIGNGGTETEDVLIQLGTQGSTVLPNITSSAVAGPIAAVYIANPTPPVVTNLIDSVVNQGATMQFSATDTGTWTCTATNSSGGAAACAGSISSGGLYTAPATVTPQQSYGGFQLLPKNHIYNTRIDSTGLDANSAAWIAGAGTVPVSYQPMTRPNYVDNTTPTLNMIFQYTPFANAPFQVPQNSTTASPFMECGWLKQQIVSGLGACDRHWWTIDKTNGNFQEGYFLFNTGGKGPSNETLADCPSAGLTTCTAVSGIRYGNSSYVLPGGAATDAAGLYIMPLTLRAQEYLQAVATSGAINHALRFTLQNGYICGSSVANACGQNATGTRHIWPATSEAFSGGGSIPYGARARLKASFDISSFSAGAKILLTELKQYGIILADGGTGWQISTEANDNAAFKAVLTEIFNALIAPSNFEFVNEQGLIVSSSSGESTTNRETVTFTRTSDSSTATADVVLTGVTVGLPNDNLTMQAGMSAQQFTAYVHGGATNTVTWSMSPSVGTLTSGGLYTPPASAASPTTTTITATSVDNGSVAASMTILILPAGAIRLTTDLTGQYTDTNGNTWWPQLQSINAEGGGSTFNGGSFPSTPDITLYKKPYYSANGNGPTDLTFNFIVPNGTYQITGKFLDNTGSPPNCLAGQRVESIEMQTVIQSSKYDVCGLSGGPNMPRDFVAQNISVTNNQLFFNLRNMGSVPVTTSSGLVFISALSIVPGTPISGSTFTPGNRVTSGITIK